MSKDGSYMSDPYANASAASSTTADVSKLGPAFGNSWSMPAAGSLPNSQPDFLFQETADPKYRRSWGDRLTYHIGLGYLTGAPTQRGSVFVAGWGGGSAQASSAASVAHRPLPARSQVWSLAAGMGFGRA